MAKNPKQTAQDLVGVIGPENVVSFTNCLTRLRLNIKPGVNVDLEKLKTVTNVMGILTPSATELQIVLGPGFVGTVTQEFGKLVNAQQTSPVDGAEQSADFVSAADVAKQVKGAIKGKSNWLQNFFTKFSRIFSPMIIGFIGAGILAGIAGIMQSAFGGDITTASAVVQSWFNALNLLLNIWKNAFIIIVGWRTAEVFGGSGVLGAMVASMYSPVFGSELIKLIINTDPNNITFLGIPIHNPASNWLTVGFRPEMNESGQWVFGYASGNILGALLTATASIWLERGVRKFMPGVLDTIGTPTLVLFALLILNIFVLIPVSGYLYMGVAWFFLHLHTNPFGAFVLAAIFLTAVAFGIHQGFVPIYAMMIQQTGVNGLFPILAMAGMAQFGTGIALWLLADKGSLLRRQIQGSLIPAFFGIGEPMIYGVTLPRVRPFITSSIGAGFAGFFIGAMSMWGNITFGLNAMFGPSGILAAFMMTTDSGNIVLAVILYLIACGISIAGGLLVTLFGYSRIVKIGGKDMKELYKKNGKYKLWQQILWTTAFCTVVGIFVYWTVSYYQLPKAERLKIAKTKVE
ncbi:PTS system N-acetylmuramic acid-specific EIIBC component [Spiroplasma syrphidicola EA-1]|uniref:PTS system N-acetylmuramic acid-specific EIIBC component n=1 Tax=Spiroplasma syrphidicola EA-1 TaxID=1276229 RepID=R4UJL6_9MOLU|nr:PTS transporter subunit EIIC [Spiroplasma syrphidicola]AGM26330.1 PTS system N-acetylmuramic acid-specific EIIBC component [Spiroplasma syrphidicola EA-1]